MKVVKTQIQSLKKLIDLEHVNVQFEVLTHDLRLFGLPSFNSDLVDTCEYDLRKIVQATISDRIVNNWERPNNAATKSRTQRTVELWMDNETRLKKLKSDFKPSTAVEHKKFAYSVGCRVLKRLKNMYNIPVDFGPGESFLSQKGVTHLVSKLDPSTHTVSKDNRWLWVELICSTRGLFSVYLEFYVRNIWTHRASSTEHISTIAVVRNNKRWKQFIVNKVIDHFPHYVVMGSRQAQVDKDNEKNRDIEVNPLGDVVLQKVVGSAFREVLKEDGIDLDQNQALHKALIMDKSYSTLDAKMASGSIILEHVFWMFPRELTVIIKQLSQEYTYAMMPDGSRAWYKQEKLCSMGSGFTFELLTTIFCSIARTYDTSAVVYGDDIIVVNEHAEKVSLALSSLGFQINWKKSFIQSPLRESCGGFFLDGYGYIRSYKFKFCNNLVEAVSNTNKLRRIIEDYEKNFCDDEFCTLLKRCYSNIVQNINPMFLGPCTNNPDIPTWVEHPDWLKRKKKSVQARALYDKNLHIMEQCALDYQNSISNYVPILEVHIRNNVDIRMKKVVKDKKIIYAYVKNGRRNDMEIKSSKKQVCIKCRLVDLEGFYAV